MSAGRTAAAALWLTLRSLLWTLLMPGLVAGYVPWRYFGLREVELRLGDPSHVVGLAAVLVGSGLLALCIWEFARRGRGTVSPVDPPRELVVEGLYRFVRNPMYVSLTILLLGQVLLTASRDLLLYWLVWFVAINVVVIAYEEPALRRQFGASYAEYRRRVGRWIPRWPRE